MSVLRSSILSETAVIILSYRLMVKFISLMLIFHSLQDSDARCTVRVRPSHGWTWRLRYMWCTAGL